ncbi:MAG: AAA family ATPase [Chloroflexi bacterium]|nr:AAA family ATPase [Chloroflexota bacterium]
MVMLHVQLFQALTVKTASFTLLDLGSPTTRSLFAYLVLHREQNLDRRRLAFQFWPHSSEQIARRNLRQYLHRIRRALEPVDPTGSLILNEGNLVRFNAPTDWTLDVAAFEQAASPPHENLPLAIQIYSGELLADIYDDWVGPERERLARLYRECLLRLSDQQEAAGQFAEAIVTAERYLTAEPYLETAHTRLMRLHYAAGNRARIAQQYQQLATILAEELGVEPLPETTAVYEAMVAGDYIIQRGKPPFVPMPPPQPPTATSQPPPSPFIGRAEDMAWMNGWWGETAVSHGHFIFLQGESGVGKTRLLDEWLGQIDTPVYLLRGRGHEFEAMIPYSPFRQALRGAAPDLPWSLFQPPPPWLSPLLSLIPDLPAYFPGQEMSAPNSGSPHHIIEGLGNFIFALARQQPVILLLDNLHWADAPTWNFLGYLAQRAGQTQLLIIGAARIEDLPHERASLLRRLQRQQWASTRQLSRLSQSETYDLVRQLMGDAALDPRFTRRIYEETEGNPFFIIETIRAVREAGGDWTQSVPTDAAGRRPYFAIPLQIQSVIQTRLDKLGDESRAALGVAAAIGREFDFALLQAVSQFDAETLLNALDEWLDRALVRETSDGYDFTHEMLSQVAYQQLSRARRQWIHLQIANHLAEHRSDADPGQLAHHYYLSTEPGKALPFLARAGQRALSVRSYAEAREFGLRAIGLLGRFPAPRQGEQTERIDLNLQLAQAYAFTGAHGKALQLLQEIERTAEALGDMTRLARIFHRSAQIFWLQGQPTTADSYSRRTLRHAEELDNAELRFAALRMLARAGIVLSHYDDAIAYLLRYIDLAGRVYAPPDLPVIYGYLGVAYARVGSWQRAIDAAQTGLDLARTDLTGATHVVARMQLAFIYAELHEWAQALAIAEPVRDTWREEGMTPHAFMLRAVIGRCLTYGDEPQQGPAEIQAALQWAEGVEHRVQVHPVQMILAQCQAQVGAYELALGTAAKSLELAERTGDLWATAACLRVHAEAEMRLNKPNWGRIEANLIRARDILRQIRARPDLARTYLALRRLYDRAGQSAWAVDCHFRATTIFEELGMSDELAVAQGRPGGERIGAVVIPGLDLQGPNVAASFDS